MLENYELTHSNKKQKAVSWVSTTATWGNSTRLHHSHMRQQHETAPQPHESTTRDWTTATRGNSTRLNHSHTRQQHETEPQPHEATARDYNSTHTRDEEDEWWWGASATSCSEDTLVPTAGCDICLTIPTMFSALSPAPAPLPATAGLTLEEVVLLPPRQLWPLEVELLPPSTVLILHSSAPKEEWLLEDSWQ